ncbi:putative outer membrane protein [Pedobacter sp. BAL39]|uniref:SusC/RagA family TonB-linked outer membrane protein n=1 Tax=Pedobacter sp. BAL39 TaxID=391596 RepID=UPI000155A185|nr:SusC/RagA family TonB-linked outer membrane protein [Pedobacter sp. BAL39]EDM38483.1 putative outer membrane protein [Pedobacter sp. BAL39]
MRLTVVLLFVSLMQVSAAGHAQKVSLSASDAPLKTILNKLSNQTGYDFVYTEQLMKTAGPISINVKNASLSEVLELIFKRQPLTYVVDTKTVILKAKEKSFIDNLIQRLQDIDLRGNVLDEDGRPIPGATIKVKGKSKNTISGLNGEFVLNNVEEGDIIQVSYLGYEPLEVKASGSLNRITLKAATSKLDEVQIQAYGTTSKRLSTSNISTVKAEDLERQPVANPLLALMGRVPGLQISQSNGSPNSGITVRVQGQNSILNGNDPFYVVDGVPYPSQLLETGLNGGNLGTSGRTPGNPLSFINPADIESIDILKDADATAIYGSRAANGAILITTKKGKSGDMKIDLSLQAGFSAFTNWFDKLNTGQYLEMRREALKNTNTSPTAANAYDILDLYGYDNSRNVDWQEEVLSKNSNFANHQLRISGGNNNTQYVIGGGYINQGSFLPGNFKNTKGTGHFNINSTSNNRKFQIQFGGSYMNDSNTLPSSTNFVAAIVPALSPNAPALYNEDGSLNFAVDALGLSTYLYGNNPMASLEAININKTRNLITHADLSYQILPGFQIKANLGYTSLSSDELVTTPLSSYQPYVRPFVTRSTQFANNATNSWIVEPQLSYGLTKEWGELNFLLGASAQNNQSDGQRITASGYVSDELLQTINGATTLEGSGTVATTYKYSAIFGRASYNYKNKYLLNYTIRRDGTSRFSPDYRFHNFQAIGAGWVFTEESFFKQHLPWLSFGKLNASYGTTGSDQIGDNLFFATYGASARTYQSIPGLSLNRIATPDLHWEETSKLNFGLKTGFFKDRVLFEVNYAINRSSDQLVAYLVPFYASGFGTVSSNFPAVVKNTSWEFALNTTNVRSQGLSWTSSFNLTIPKNTLVSFPDLARSSYASRLVIGESVNITKQFHFLGVDPATGQYVYSDSNGNPTMNPNSATDYVSVDLNPKFYGGFQNTFTYKSLSFDFLFQFMNKKAKNEYFTTTLAGSVANNQPDFVTNRWRNPGDIAERMLYTTSSSVSFNNSFLYNDAGFTSASYIKLRNASLSWKVPEAWTKKVLLRSASVFVLGQNLLTISDYYGRDPEFNSNTSYPASRTVTFGARLGI